MSGLKVTESQRLIPIQQHLVKVEDLLESMRQKKFRADVESARAFMESSEGDTVLKTVRVSVNKIMNDSGRASDILASLVVLTEKELITAEELLNREETSEATTEIRGRLNLLQQELKKTKDLFGKFSFTRELSEEVRRQQDLDVAIVICTGFAMSTMICVLTGIAAVICSGSGKN